MIHRPGRSVGRSHRSHRLQALLCGSGGMSDVLLSEISLITQRRSHAPVLALPHAPQSLNGESTGWNISREKCTHLTG